MAASSDYGVSIVESYAPPKNIVPGQTVNKDVYAVNTGNVDAFVKESISGILNYDYEEVVDSFAETNVQLTTAQVKAVMGQIATEDGITTYEAGSYLAWTDAEGVDIEAVNIGRKADVDDTENKPAVPAGTWKPTKEGAYIFRRAINHGEDEATNPFTYAGYYYVPTDTVPGNGKYYKIVLGNDDINYPYATTDPSTTPVSFVYDIYTDYSAMGFTGTVGANVDTDTGVLKTDPTYRFVKLTEMEDKAVNLEMDSVNKRLIATYGNGLGTATPESAEAQAKVAQAKVNLENAKAAYDAAVVSEKNAKANLDYATDLAKAENKLYEALKAYQDKYAALNNPANGDPAGTKATFDNAASAVNKYAKAMQDGTDRTDASIGLTDGILAISGTQGGSEYDIEDGSQPLRPQVAVGGIGIFTQNEWDGYGNSGATPVHTNDYVQNLRSSHDYQDAMDTYGFVNE